MCDTITIGLFFHPKSVELALMNNNINVIKRDGEQASFDDHKVIHSMIRTGVPENLFEKALFYIKSHVQKDTITTDEIFYYIQEFLKDKDKKSAVRFNLRRAIFELGPTGFPFEQLLQRIFENEGYKATVGIIMEGECVSHEIDVVIEKNGKKEIIEAKFHNQNGGKTDIQTMLYMYARFLDVKESNDISNVWVATNTKLTQDAIRYAQCKGIKALAWNYPENDNLQDFVEKPGMYPVTILSELTMDEKRRLIEGDVVLACNFLSTSDKELERRYLIDKNRIQEAKQSARLVCNVAT